MFMNCLFKAYYLVSLLDYKELIVIGTVLRASCSKHVTSGKTATTFVLFENVMKPRFTLLLYKWVTEIVIGRNEIRNSFWNH